MHIFRLFLNGYTNPKREILFFKTCLSHDRHIRVTRTMLKRIKHFQLLCSVIRHPEPMRRHKKVSDIRKQFPNLTFFFRNKLCRCPVCIYFYIQ